MSERLQHLVLVRHGEDEGDARRAAWRRGEHAIATKPRDLEEITELGEEQSCQAGLWIINNVLEKHNLKNFDYCGVSPALRSKQSMVALGLPNNVWQENPNLNERDRGKIRGLKPTEHQVLDPDSYAMMTSDPLHWIPPGLSGQAIIPHVVNQVEQFMVDIEGAESILAVTHRDWMWAAQLILEHLSEAELLAVNTDNIHCGQVIHYTSINPITGEQTSRLAWKLSVDPMDPGDTAGWQPIK